MNGAPSLVDLGIVPNGAASRQWGASVASDGVNYLVAWCDNRGPNGSYVVLTARVRASDGVILDPTPREIAQARPTCLSTAVSASAGGYLVAWAEGGYGEVIKVRKVTTDNQTSGTAHPVVRFLAAPLDIALRVGFDGTQHLVLWQRKSSGAGVGRSTVEAQVVDTHGVLVAGDLDSPRLVHYAPFSGGSPWKPALAYGVHTNPDGGTVGGYIAAWSRGRTVEAAALDATGVAGEVQTISAPFTVETGAPSVAYDGTQFAIAWDEDVGMSSFATNVDVKVQYVTHTGSWIDFPFEIAKRPGHQRSSSIAFDGTKHLVAWTDTSGPNRIAAQRMLPDGTLLDGPPDTGSFPVVALSTSARSETASAFQGNWLVVVDAEAQSASLSLHLVHGVGNVVDAGAPDVLDAKVPDGVAADVVAAPDSAGAVADGQASDAGVFVDVQADDAEVPVDAKAPDAEVLADALVDAQASDAEVLVDAQSARDAAPDVTHSDADVAHTPDAAKEPPPTATIQVTCKATPGAAGSPLLCVPLLFVLFRRRSGF